MQWPSSKCSLQIVVHSGTRRALLPHLVLLISSSQGRESILEPTDTCLCHLFAFRMPMRRSSRPDFMPDFLKFHQTPVKTNAPSTMQRNSSYRGRVQHHTDCGTEGLGREVVAELSADDTGVSCTTVSMWCKLPLSFISAAYRVAW